MYIYLDYIYINDASSVARVAELSGGRAFFVPQFEKEKSTSMEFLHRLLRAHCGQGPTASQAYGHGLGFEAVLKIRFVFINEYLSIYFLSFLSIYLSIVI